MRSFLNTAPASGCGPSVQAPHYPRLHQSRHHRTQVVAFKGQQHDSASTSDVTQHLERVNVAAEAAAAQGTEPAGDSTTHSNGNGGAADGAHGGPESPWASLLETKFSLEAQSQPSQPPNQPGDPPGTSLVQQQPHVSSIPEGQQLWRQLQQQSEGQQLRQLQQQERMRAMEAQVAIAESRAQTAAMADKVAALEMQVSASERERQLEVGMILTNFSNARAQGAAAAAEVVRLKDEVTALRKVAEEAQARERDALKQLAEVQAQLAALVPAAQVQEVTSRLAAAEAAAKEAAAALQAGRVREAELEQELSESRRQLAVTEEREARKAEAAKTLRARAAAARAQQKQQQQQEQQQGEGATAPTGGVVHTNTNRYHVPTGSLFAFMRALTSRETLLWDAQGFKGMEVQQSTPQDYVVRTLWADAASFEAWATGPGRAWGQYEALPDEVRQYAPKGRGDGVPESYVAFRAGSPPPDPQ